MDNLLYGVFFALNIIGMTAFACTTKHKEAFGLDRFHLTKKHYRLIGTGAFVLGFMVVCLSYAPFYFVVAWFLSLSGMAAVVYAWVMLFNK